MRLRDGLGVILLFSLLAPALPASGASGPAIIIAGHEDHGEGEGEGGGPIVAPALGPVLCENGFADVYPCNRIDLLSFVPLADLGDNRTAGIWGWADPQTRREYALIAMSQRAVFVDVTDAGRPRVVGYLPGHTNQSTNNREISVYRDHALVVADGAGNHGIQIFDLTQLRGASGEPVRFSETAWYGDVGPVHTIFVNTDTGFAYANGSSLCNAGLHFVDVRDPRNPRSAGCFSNEISGRTYVHDTQCVIYRGPDSRFSGREICFASNPSALQVVDVTDKSAPSLLGQASYPNAGYMHQGWLTEDQRYFLMDDELDESQQGLPTTTHLWDVSDLTAPQRFATHEASTRATDHNQFVRGGLLYQANYRAGLRVLDLRNVAGGRLEEIGFFDTVPGSDEAGFSGAWGLYPFFPSGNIAVSSIDRGLFMVRPRAGSSQPNPTVCRPASDRLCLLRNRYLVTVTWRNQFNGATGRGTSRRASDLSGYFTFGDPANLELMIKVLDFGGEVRLFYGQLTNLEFEIRVLDTVTGQVRNFRNGPNNCGAIASLGGSATSTAAPVQLRSHLFDFARPGRGISARSRLGEDVRQETGEHEAGKCVPARDRLCLGHRRFQVEVDWHNQFDGGRGTGRATALSELTGSFAFQDPSNVELLVKTLEFKEDDQVLILWGALSNLEYTLKVTDTLSGEVQTYHNPPGTYCGGLDQDAF